MNISREFNILKDLIKIALCLFACGFGGSNSFATIIVSGDVSIAYPALISDLPSPFDELVQGNERFFSNILQGSDNVAILGQQSDSPDENIIQIISSFYSSNGITSSVITTITTSTLEDVGLLVIPLPLNVITNDELSVMSSYNANGGSIFFLGEAKDHAQQNTNINLALLGLGSTLNIADNSDLDNSFDISGPYIATGGQIVNNSFTLRVQSLFYGGVSEIKGGDGRLAPLFKTTNGTPFIAYEKPLSVPEPTTIALVFIGFPSLLFFIRKRRK